MKTQLTSENIREQIANMIQTVLCILVDDPENLSVKVIVGENTTIFHVETDRKNIGQVLGSRGKHIDCLRTLVNSMAGKHNIRAVVEIPYFPKTEKTSA